MATKEFKPYRHEKCIIYTEKNRKFLEGIAERLKTMKRSEVLNLDGKKQNYGGIRYEITIVEPEQQVIISTVPQSKKNKGTIVLSEDYR